jgi:hypothetical protein
LVTHADKLLGAQSQVDPKFQTEILYTRMTGESLRAALAESLNIPIGMIVGTTTSDSIVDTLERWWQEVDQESDENNQPATAASDWPGALVRYDPTSGGPNDVTDAMSL